MDTEPSPSTGRKLIALIPEDGQEPVEDLSDAEAEAAWAVATGLWHPALLARVESLPHLEDAAAPFEPAAGEVRVVAPGALGRLPEGYPEQAEAAGAVLLEGATDRLELARRVLDRLGPGAVLGEVEAEDGGRIALDFLALGAARWWVRDLTTAMGHVDCLDLEHLTREVLAGARAWQGGDWPTAAGRLRAAFELLIEARERFYPVDAYFVDICLLDPSTPAGALADSLAARAPVSFLAPARAIEALHQIDPASLAALRGAIDEGWADVMGGASAEVDEPLLPVASILWQFHRGGETYRRLLDGRSVETLARRRFALYPMLPQVARRFGFRYALHLGLDAGSFPVRPEAKRLWGSPDGSSLEALTRPPVAADRAAEGLRLPWRLARTMRDDHVATVPLVHWPEPVAGWYRDLRRGAAYSPVLARWVTAGDYFHLTDRPWETFQADPDQYAPPYLAQAVSAGDPAPISRRAHHVRLRARFDALGWVRALTSVLAVPGPALDEGGPGPEALEDAIETGRLDEAASALDLQEPAWAGALARGVVGTSTLGRAGFLVLNPLGVARRAAVLLPGAAADLRPEGPLRAAQATDEGTWAVVDLPAFGYAWVPRESIPDAPTAPSHLLSARGRTLASEALEIEIDEATGGLRAVRGPREAQARLGQQLVMTGLIGPDGQPATSRMRGETFQVDSAGPALLQARTTGALLDPADGRVLARFRQRFRLWTGRPVLEIDIERLDLDPAWLDRVSKSDPWVRHLACRWAWPDPNSMLRRTCLLGPELTESERPETPDALDISTRRQRTGLLFGGLAHHRRCHPRMLDTLLIAGRESARSFQLGVVLDLEYPHQAALDLTTPCWVIPTAAGPPRSGPVGWFFRAEGPSVAVLRVAPTEPGQSPGLIFDLIETSHRSARCRLRLFRDPAHARQVDFRGDSLAELSVDGDTVLIDLLPRELVRVVVSFS